MAKGQGFDGMSEQRADEIRSKGGKATGAKNLTREARAKGGRNSHSGGRRSGS